MFRGGIGTVGGGDFTNLASYEGLVFNVQAAAFGSQTTRMIINNSGNVGIGTTGPDSQLQTTGKAHLYNVFVGGPPAGGTPDYSPFTDSVVGSDNLHLSARSGGNLYLNTLSGSGNVYILPNGGGNVGIGTASPQATLDVNGKVAEHGNALVPAGAIILWSGSACPAGYTRLSTYDDLFLVSASTAGTTGGSNTHDHGGATGSHALTTAEMPSHTHRIGRGDRTQPDSMRGLGSNNSYGFYDPTVTDGTGGNGGHTHPMAPADSRPAFKTVLLCQKD